jgi:hypothetical protein
VRIVLITFLVFLSCVSFYAQDKEESTETKPVVDLSFDDGCGNPLVESQTYGYRTGKVIKITNSNDLIVKVTNSNNIWDDEKEDGDESQLIEPQIFKVLLVGIDKGFNKKEIKKFLTEKILNQEVQIIGNTKNSWKTKKDTSRKLNAVVRLLGDEEDIDDISEYLLENGIAKFKDFQLTNLVPMRTRCEFERAGEKAKKEKSGIWAK